MTQDLKHKLLSLTSARYKHLLVAMENFREGEDPLGIMLRVHLTAESILEELIRVAFAGPASNVASIVCFSLRRSLLSILFLARTAQASPDHISPGVCDG